MSDKTDPDEKSDDIDVKMYVPFSCVDCGQEFESREQLKNIKQSMKIYQKTRADI